MDLTNFKLGFKGWLLFIGAFFTSLFNLIKSGFIGIWEDIKECLSCV